MKWKLKHIIGCLLYLCFLSCNQQVTQSRVFVNKEAQKRYTNAEKFVQQHFKDYEVEDNVLFEFHTIYFNNDDEFTISRLGSYQSIAEFTADNQLLFQIAENRKESYTGYVMLRNYDLYKEIKILDENDVFFYFPDAVKMQTDYRTKAFYELDSYVQEHLKDYDSAGNEIILWAIPVEERKLAFDKIVDIGKGASTREILLNAFENNLPIILDAVYVELTPQHVLQNYRIADLHNELQAVKNYLEGNKANADSEVLLKNLKDKQNELSVEFSKLNKQLISINENETVLRQLLLQILNKIDN